MFYLLKGDYTPDASPSAMDSSGVHKGGTPEFRVVKTLTGGFLRRYTIYQSSRGAQKELLEKEEIASTPPQTL